MHSAVQYDVVVIGAGHAGTEAALAAARMGARTLVLTPNLARVGFMPCNPSIGGPAKSQIVAEVDALGGAMAEVADATAMQARLLNTSKGPAVQAIRLQCDKSLYAIAMKERIELQPNLDLVQDEAIGVMISSGSNPQVTGISLRHGGDIRCSTVVVTAGTFLRARMISGEASNPGGRAGDTSDARLSASLAEFGLRLKRFKTGTPPRLDAGSIDTSRCERQPGDEAPRWISRRGAEGQIPQLALAPAPTGIFSHPELRGGRWQVPCFQTATNAQVHELILANLDRSPMYNGSIEGTGPRYCPSIEDKVGRFADKTSHPVFIEPEGWRSHEVYVQGLSTSLPADIQHAVVTGIQGLESARITRYGYAVEYDALDATELRQTLESRKIAGLFMAGQVNGTSGYEEAAGQGLIAGANAGALALGLPELILSRTDGYIGVMIDDLTSQQFSEPYRMLTSRAEYRLILRADTADARLAERAAALGLIAETRRRDIASETAAVATIQQELAVIWLGDNPRHAAALAAEDLAPANRSMTALDLARRPRTRLDAVLRAMAALDLWHGTVPSGSLLDRMETAIAYSTFIEKEEREADRHRRAAEERLQADMDYFAVRGLRVEAQQRLDAARPLTISQAQRTPGVTPGDISALMVHLSRMRASHVQYGPYGELTTREQKAPTS